MTAPLIDHIAGIGDADLARLRALIAAGRISAGALLHHPTPLADAEDMRRLLMPTRMLRQRLGLPLRTAIAHDVNGLPWPMTQLLLDADIELLMMGVNPTNGGVAVGRHVAFRWQASDGRPLLVFAGEPYGEFQRIAGLKAGYDLRALGVGLAGWLERLAARGWRHGFAVLTATHPNKGDNNPPDPRLVALVRAWNDAGRSPIIRFATPEDVLARLRTLAEADLPLTRGDWTDWWNSGAGSSARETAIARRARSHLVAADLLGAQQPGVSDAIVARARSALDWWHEHTWGAAASVERIHDEEVIGQWRRKAVLAHDAADLAHLALRDRCEAVTGNPPDADGAGSLLVVNASAVDRDELVCVPSAWLDGTWRHLPTTISRPPGAGTWVGPVRVPAHGWRMVPIASLTAASLPSDVVAVDCRIETRFHRLEFDPRTGRITSLIDRRSGWDAIDGDSPWNWFGFVHERVDPSAYPHRAPDWGRRAFVEGETWHADWPAVRSAPTALRSCAVETDAFGPALVLRWDAPGVDGLEQRIALDARAPEIRCEASFVKHDGRDAESVYFAFPLAIARGWRAGFDTAGLPVELDDEQLPGACRDWITVERSVTVRDGANALTLACPDAPLVQVGGFHVGLAARGIVRDARPLLLAWAMNNYWFTNFRPSQPGACRLRWTVATHAAMDVASPRAVAAAACAPLVCHPVVGTRDEVRQVCAVRGEDVVALHVAPEDDAPDPGWIIALIANQAAAPRQARIARPGLAIVAARLVSTLGEPLADLAIDDGEVLVDLPPRALRRVALGVRPAAQ
ncbi:MAG: hypothetical protein H0X45_06590 [Planctomycetes bacterium]|nr:hypothetical protein [Planctomycetota bacterium]